MLELLHRYTYIRTRNFVKNSNSRLFKVKSGHQGIKLGSKSSNKGQIRVKSGKLFETYPIYISFDSEFCPEFKFMIL